MSEPIGEDDLKLLERLVHLSTYFKSASTDRGNQQAAKLDKLIDKIIDNMEIS